MPFTLLLALFFALSSDAVKGLDSNMFCKDIIRTFILMERYLTIDDVNRMRQTVFHVGSCSYSLSIVSFHIFLSICEAFLYMSIHMRNKFRNVWHILLIFELSLFTILLQQIDHLILIFPPKIASIFFQWPFFIFHFIFIFSFYIFALFSSILECSYHHLTTLKP